MKNLLRKELLLSIHPTAYLFLALSSMLLIPNYPYLVAFFYTGLSVFFICLNGRENGDIPFMMLMPIAKRDIVRARFLLVVLLQTAQIALSVPFAVLRQNIMPEGNAAGMDANLTLLGCAFVLYGIFNIVFLTSYYKKVSRVGVPFLVSSAAVFVWVGIVEASAFLVPFVREKLDTPDTMFRMEKLIVLLFGAGIYVLLTYIAFRRSVGSFEKQDL
ncbi:MAG: ABC-2 transporter permease [Clostridia bacterium]|nr:ABC-2 transporter permease [Clostridia bacterium]